jgi:CRP/FNR family transcriptional regulator, cyclic AMP receptor protein
MLAHGTRNIENYHSCELQVEQNFCGSSISTLDAFERIKLQNAYPKDAVLFIEGQAPRGIFVLCKGKVKLSLCTGDGRTFILKVAQAGDVLGISASISGRPYEATAEALEASEASFIKRENFLRFLKANPDACFRVAEQLGRNYSNACHEVRSLGLSQSSGEKLCKLLLEWVQRYCTPNDSKPCIRLPITQDEMAQMIGCCRETVTRLFADLKRRGIAECKTSILRIHDKSALQALADNRLTPLKMNREHGLSQGCSRIA